ncbi:MULTISPECIES: flagellar basal body-associated FliL family protein [Enterobacteriaceae]|jgi:flagellar FliL protein|uniref:flagellar basal body-associated FliL family protein n=3 Tax=Enterobacterales TaxID=91347 RepID=UPI000E98E796|nr:MULTISPECIES: flagellar basal body-associated FliL family protein [Enterobacteriaceae]MDF2776596.1 flagellar basal body protein FliL [Enterobacteriaceae bacterium]WPO94413.1 flagellar basal body-associated FliL family protein [Buttiauxella sp. HR94]HAZ76910.1 flagellar basal body protein FliL [Enterobacteriaceae bacterium]
MKKIVFACLGGIALFIAVGGGAAWFIFNYMQTHGPAVENTAAKSEVQRKKQHKTELFVTLKESVITLSDDAGEDRYMLLALTLVAESEAASKKIQADEPLYQSIILATLADMQYEQLRTLKVNDIKLLLSAALDRELKKRAVPEPYSDILINKLVFQ